MLTPTAIEKAGFVILETAPAGGTASVYKARHISTGELCALKITEGEYGAAALAREASVLKQLNHPSIVCYFAEGAIDEASYLATRWVTGCRLAEIIKNSAPLEESRAKALFSQIASAIQYAHDHGVVHADISTANILVDNHEKITLLDFGISRQTDVTTVTADSAFTGTLRYIAPELIKGEKATTQSDQYSVAVILYEMLSASWPYDGDASAAAALHNHLYSEPVRLQERIPTVSAQLSESLQKSLSKAPDDRFTAIYELAESLSRHKPDNSLINAGTRRPGLSSSLRLSGKAAVVLATATVVTGFVWQLNGVGDSRRFLFPVSHAVEVAPQCNLLKAPALSDDGTVENFYGEDGMPDRITLTRRERNQWQLGIGKSDQWGLYGQIVEVAPDKQYHLTVDVTREGYLHMPALRVEWLDSNYQLQPDWMTEYRIDSIKDGRITMPAVRVPEGAAFAVPTVYKDETEGTMTIYALVFHAADCS